ncbi:uncharacterized protein LOC130765954 isoform X2 [Actinidia eriantha]|nr:uncharacterized protein LOC130765954 isoform X2 [Actinidia eriantha]
MLEFKGLMANLSEEEEEQFFDTRDEIASVFELASNLSDNFCSSPGYSNYTLNGFGHEFWTKTPESAHHRRHRFLKWLGLSSDQNQIEKEESRDKSCDEVKMEIDRINEDSGAVLGNSNLEDCFLSSRSSLSCCSTEETDQLAGEDASHENSLCKFKNLDDGMEFVVDGVSNNGVLISLLEVGSNRLVTYEEFQRNFGSSSLVQQLLRREAEADNLIVMKNKVKSGWLRKLGFKACIVGRQGEAHLKSSGFDSKVGARFQRVRVRSSRKRSKELSSLYSGQEFIAHEGSILTMKFSPDGQYLASAGKDGIVRVWKVIKVERPNKLEIQHVEPSCSYFSLNHFPLDVSKDKIVNMRRSKNSSVSAGVIFPPKVFRIVEEPLHEFHGHSGEVLALSWSKNGSLLSSSVDKTVRLWQVGHNQCLRIYYHNNYVTSVEFNPVDDNFFISGSIDGKVRIWEVHGCRVVDWIDIREIVTAVCYCPHGKGGIVGLMDGSCHFYDIIDNQLQLDAQIFLQGKKKLPCKRITGFQFCPSDPSKVLVTSADSQVRVLRGVDVIYKLKGRRISGSQVTASFTADGKHIVSASEDSNICIWDYGSQDITPSRAKNIWSCESFFSHNASIAIPWCSMPGSLPNPSVGDDLVRPITVNGQCNEDLLKSLPLSSPNCFSLSRGLLLESLSKGSVTWPEEKLPNSRLMAISPKMSTSEYKLWKSACQNTHTSHMWGLVIVTAGRDGRIRTYHNYGLPIRL